MSRFTKGSTFLIDSLKLANGNKILNFPVTYHTYGQLSPSRDNVILVCHGATFPSDIRVWSPKSIGPSKVYDTSKYLTVCCNVLGSPFGSVSPISINSETGKPYGTNFPDICAQDNVAAHKQVLDHLGIRSVKYVIGASLGGFHAMEWLVRYPDFIKSGVLVQTAAKCSPWLYMWVKLWQSMIRSDPHFCDGNYEKDKAQLSNMALMARLSALLLFRTEESYFNQFVYKENLDSIWDDMMTKCAKTLKGSDPLCLLKLLEQDLTHDISYGSNQSVESVLKSIKQPVLILSSRGDMIFSDREQEALRRNIPNAIHREIPSIHGHDSFLVDEEVTGDIIMEWMNSVD